MQIDQVRPPVSTDQVYKVQRKKRSARDTNREKRPGKTDNGDERRRREHIDELV